MEYLLLLLHGCLAKVAVQCSADTFVVYQSLVLRINICGENRHLRKAANHKSLIPIIMTIEDLHNKLTALKIPADQYYLHGLYGSPDDNDKVSLTIKRGKYTLEYEIYYREKGEKHSIQTFTDENEACNYILNKFTKKL